MGGKRQATAGVINNKFNRMLYMFEKLIKGELIQKKAVASHFSVSEKTVQRDIFDLNDYFGNTEINERFSEVLYDRKRKGFYLNHGQIQWLKNDDALAIA